MDNTAFITQLATFNSLSQLTSIKDSTAAMQQSLTTLNQLIAGAASVAVNPTTSTDTSSTNTSTAATGTQGATGTGGTN
jgi:hypothetical protein